MQIFFDPRHAMHDPQHFLARGQPKRCPEMPERAERLLAAAKAAGHGIAAPQDFGLGPVAAVHGPDYLRFLQTAAARWRELPDAGAEVIPNVHPRNRSDGYPASVVGQAGFHQQDTACPIGEGTWEAAVASAQSALSAARLVAEGERVAYALCRPPGHHAYRDQAAGFCFLNNSAIAAEFLRGKAARVAILDVDVHHGNGTQDIFYGRGDVLTVSLHADPTDFYPFFVGYAHERGEGQGLGYNLNLPLAKGTGDAAYLTALQTALTQIQAFQPGFLVVALGLDAHEGDPFQGLKITTGGFRRIAAAIAALGLPTVLVQEGGYLSDALGKNLASFLAGFEAAA